MYELLTENDKQKWSEQLERFKNEYDIYSTFHYCDIASKHDEALPRMFIYTKKNLLVAYPFLLRKINKLDFMKDHQSEDVYDIITPYGYGGPIVKGDTSLSSIKDFREQFNKFCYENNIITEFIRFHPLQKNHSFFPPFLEISHVNNTVSIFLDKEESDLLQSFHQNHRRNVNKAKKNNLSFELLQGEKAFSSIKNFKVLYDDTMKKNNANAYYYFSEDYFKQMFATLGQEVAMAIVKQSDEVIAAAIFFMKGKIMQYHLGASLKEKLNLGSNPFLFFEASKWGRANGLKYLHLGGGYKIDDPLFTFKKRFNEQGITPFYIGKKIHNTSIYEQLAQLWKSHYQSEPNDSFFPKYRQIGDNKHEE